MNVVTKRKKFEVLFMSIFLLPFYNRLHENLSPTTLSIHHSAISASLQSTTDLRLSILDLDESAPGRFPTGEQNVEDIYPDVLGTNESLSITA